tara:strand:+ start:1467 stop:1973 length:507 start_codon:yes stop_codon:yes gene_type:complete
MKYRNILVATVLSLGFALSSMKVYSSNILLELAKRSPRLITTSILGRGYSGNIVKTSFSTSTVEKEVEDESALLGEYYNPTGEKLALIGPKIPVTLIPEYDMAALPNGVSVTPGNQSSVTGVFKVKDVGYLGLLKKQDCIEKQGVSIPQDSSDFSREESTRVLRTREE